MIINLFLSMLHFSVYPAPHRADFSSFPTVLHFIFFNLFLSMLHFSAYPVLHRADFSSFPAVLHFICFSRDCFIKIIITIIYINTARLPASAYLGSLPGTSLMLFRLSAHARGAADPRFAAAFDALGAPGAARCGDGGVAVWLCGLWECGSVAGSIRL
jgi:hypothetical protein